jgi:hydrogenase maturation protein HypF
MQIDRDSSLNPTNAVLARWRMQIRGIVQGVGFRPFVYGLALQLNLRGFVQNDSHGVLLELEGTTTNLETFAEHVRLHPPPLARIDQIVYHPIPVLGSSNFVIMQSAAGTLRNTLISPDMALCADCRRELFDPQDRRYRYPFINCTNCGPRFTIVADVPYDRAKTSMHPFVMCPTCQAEYDDPHNRRFHAQPNACPTCGPHMVLCHAGQPTQPIALADAAMHACAQALVAGQIVAIKGLGGYHLACLATDAAAVARLRQRKQREAKPLALMVADQQGAAQICLIDPLEATLLNDPRRPIVLLRQRPEHGMPAELAPGQQTFGVMLPYTPLHEVLFATLASYLPATLPLALVMTSGNLSDEPIAYRDADAHTRLAGIADLVLAHNREILMRCDDSVTRVAAAGEQIIRRARGAAPAPITLDLTFDHHVLACGAHLKNTFCLAKQNQAFLSHHIGDLENLETLESFHEGIAHFQRLFDIAPEVVAYDLHPEYLATKAALAMPIPTKIAVQHHHAHIASVLAEHGVTEPVIGIAADGTGYGSDGTIWGGEIMIADLAGFSRVGHLTPIPLPGGDQAVRQPWRVALAYLDQIYGDATSKLDLPMLDTIPLAEQQLVRQLIRRRVNALQTTSMGRLFDAVAALLGIRTHAYYEGQAAIELEALAIPSDDPYPFDLHDGDPFQIDLRQTLQALIADRQQQISIGVIAGRFHMSVIMALTTACLQVRATTGISTVALSGGVFQNRLLLEGLITQLHTQQFRPLINRRVPPNDGGISLGQAAIAAYRQQDR